MMKKILASLLVCLFLGVNSAPMAYSQSVSGPTGSSTATVQQYLEFSMKIVKKMDSATFDPLISPFNQGLEQTSPSFDFGTLQKVIDKDPTSKTYNQLLYMRGENFYYVLMIASTSGRKYHIQETGTQLTGGASTLALGSVILVPEYQVADKLGGIAQGAMPGSAYVGPPTTACGTTPALVYQSDIAGLGRIVRAVIAISGPAAGQLYPANSDVGGTTANQFMDGNAYHGQTTVKWVPITTDQPAGTYLNGSMTFTLVLG